MGSAASRQDSSAPSGHARQYRRSVFHQLPSRLSFHHAAPSSQHTLPTSSTPRSLSRLLRRPRRPASPARPDMTDIRRHHRFSLAGTAISSGISGAWSRVAPHRTRRTSLSNRSATHDARPSEEYLDIEMPDVAFDFDELSGTMDTASPTVSRNSSDMSPNLASSLRRRGPPIVRGEDQIAILSRLLSAAAAMTAETLLGRDHRTVTSDRDASAAGEEGSFDNFLQSLRSGQIASALRQSANETDGESEGSNPEQRPLNFFRMFRFGSAGRQGNDNAEGSPEGRMIPIIIVGIRSISGGNDEPNINPFFEALSAHPPALQAPTDDSFTSLRRQTQNGPRAHSHRRTASMGGFRSTSGATDSDSRDTSYERTREGTHIPLSPIPPPSTPANGVLPELTPRTSINNPPSQLPSAPSASTSSTSDDSRNLSVSSDHGIDGDRLAPPPFTRRRPRERPHSQPDFGRFGSGSPRRNGVIAPDNLDESQSSRSWIIYVLGGSYPENHPILTTSSLFTDSPSYEDMLLLTSLLGPVKPPVASAEDVAAAPGIFRIQERLGTLHAIAVEGSDMIPINAGQRCLVCLCDFAIDEECRRLVECSHFFHRECIDQWLTTGRNSCPLCRGRGVEETSQAEEAGPSLTGGGDASATASASAA
ncbi:hypothetical protein P152DRAFT_477344 [Eremomyces bilateralis CBS 781.70]|uniref:RING-type domain-containing protein n=1 Tax=Eremomyces bilateralis CBS 781.70 TaxID=1392243 RepID=A0A6G1FRW4_9PEZI|nr:uncharacterized protein P152DRAFT_477344 [Eremomyces bilateralis CBS 781.70]KAF1808431.1 hypothetical protein P152DRAFT_477344 [Eremomyces bilateralis CBS 781.70]